MAGGGRLPTLDHVVGGRLYLDGEFWRLTLFGWLGPWDRELDAFDTPSVIHGLVGSVQVTLLDLVPGGWRGDWDAPPYESMIAVNTLIAGAHLTESATFRSARVRILHLNEWADRPPWTFPTHSGDRRHETVVFTDPGHLTAALPGAAATLSRGWRRKLHDLSSVTMTSDEWVHFSFSRPLDLEGVEHDYVRPFRSLIELAAHARSPVLELALVEASADEYHSGSTVLSAAHRGPIPEPQ